MMMISSSEEEMNCLQVAASSSFDRGGELQWKSMAVCRRQVGRSKAEVQK